MRGGAEGDGDVRMRLVYRKRCRFVDCMKQSYQQQTKQSREPWEWLQTVDVLTAFLNSFMQRANPYWFFPRSKLKSKVV